MSHNTSYSEQSPNVKDEDEEFIENNGVDINHNDYILDHDDDGVGIYHL